MKDQIIVIDRKGKEHVLEAEEGLVLMEIIRDAGLPIEAACGGCAACATCHVYIDKDWLNKLKAREDEEESLDNSVEANQPLDGADEGRPDRSVSDLCIQL